MRHPVFNPYTGKTIEEIELLSDSAIEKSLARANNCFVSFKTSPRWERATLLKDAYQKLLAQRDRFAKLVSDEAGKPIALARIEVDRAATLLEWTAAECLRDNGELIPLDVSPSSRGGIGLHQRFPRGPVLGITPFNFPLNLAIHKIAPAIASGSPIIIKPSLETPLTAIATGELFDSAPKGLLEVLPVSDENAAKLVRDDRVKTISFTGSPGIGWTIRKNAERKPVVLELGGNAWVAVCSDTSPSEFERIAKEISNAALGYAGQSCISVQNIAIATEIYSDFLPVLKKQFESVPVGDPSKEATLCGPIINQKSKERIFAQLEKSSNASSGNAQGLVLSPQLVIYDENESDELVQGEIFGPVATVRPFSRLENFVDWVNSGRFGLQAGAYTNKWDWVRCLHQSLEVGGLVVNTVPTTRYDHQPYGGVKDSGVGREGPRFAIEEFTESRFLSLVDPS